MNALKVFQNDQFGEVRTLIDEKGNPMFCGIDVAKALGYADTTNAIKQHCRGVVKHHLPHPQSPEKQIEMNFIPESDVYRLIIRSNLPAAEAFERWLMEEVLPSIRKHGFYGTDQAIDSFLSDPDRMIQVLTAYKQERTRRLSLEREAGINAPKIFFAESVAASKHSILVGELAKLLKQNGIEVGQNRLSKWLRRDGYLIKRGDSYNMPTQYSMENEWMEIKERVIHNPDGSIRVWRTPKVTGKGQVYFISRYLAEPI